MIRFSYELVWPLKLKIWFSTFNLKYLHGYIVFASYLKISFNAVNFCDFWDFKIICQKKKKSRNIYYYAPKRNQTNLEIKTNNLIQYGGVCSNISGDDFFFDKIGCFFTILPLSLHFWLQSLKKYFNQDKFGIFWQPNIVPRAYKWWLDGADWIWKTVEDYF